MSSIVEVEARTPVDSVEVAVGSTLLCGSAQTNNASSNSIIAKAI